MAKSSSARIPFPLPRLDEEEPNQRSRPTGLPAVTAPGPRKLIRPPLPNPRARFRSYSTLYTSSAHQPLAAPPPPAGLGEDSHAETFYLRKQVQAQTSMVIVLEGGERIQGVIEWYDRDAIKIRHGYRTLIYKSSIKYLFKSSEYRRH